MEVSLHIVIYITMKAYYIRYFVLITAHVLMVFLSNGTHTQAVAQHRAPRRTRSKRCSPSAGRAPAVRSGKLGSRSRR